VPRVAGNEKRESVRTFRTLKTIRTTTNEGGCPVDTAYLPQLEKKDLVREKNG